MLLCVCALTPGAIAGPPALDRDVIASVPSQAELVVILNGGADHIDEPAARVSIRMLEEAGLLSEPVREAWGELADILALSPRDAFDELLGHRCAFFGRYSGTDGLRWALLTQVSERSGSRIRRRLSLAPRERRGERVINIGEGGGYMLAIGKPVDGWCSMLLAEPESRDMFDDALPMLTGAGGRDNLGAHPAFDRMPIDVRADAIFILNELRDGTASLSTCSLNATPDGYDGSIVVALGEPIFADRRAAWSPTMLDRLDNDAIAVVLGVIGSDVVQSVVLRLADEALGGFAELLAARFGGRIAIVIETERGAVEDTWTPTLGVSAALETNDVYRTSIDLDQAMSEVVPRLEKLFGSPALRRAPDYEGAHYEAVRVEPLQGPLADMLALAIGPKPAMTWVSCRWGRPRRANEPPDNMVARTGWWCFGSASADADARANWPVKRLCDELSAELIDERPTRRVIGVIRPRRFVEFLEERAGPPLFQSDMLAWIDEVRWHLDPARDALLTGAMTIRLDVERLDEP